MSEPIEKQDNAEAPEKSEEAIFVDIEDISNLYEGTITIKEPNCVDWTDGQVWAMGIKSEALRETVLALVYADMKLGTPVLFSFKPQGMERRAKHVWFKEDGVWTLDNKALAKAEEPEPHQYRYQIRLRER